MKADDHISGRGDEMLPIPGWEGIYSITFDGEVWSHGGKFDKRRTTKPRWLKHMLDRDGYHMVWLRDPITLKAVKGRKHRVHQLVLLTWGPPRPSLDHIPNHRDFNQDNNHVLNLDWVTPAGNVQWTIAHGRSVSVVPRWETLSEESKAARKKAFRETMTGRVYSAEYRAAISRGLKGRPSPGRDRIWITNGTDNQRIKPDAVIPGGWRRGRARFIRRQ